MSQANPVLLPGSPLSGATFFTDMQGIINALFSASSGTSAPTVGPGASSALVLGQKWLDTSATPYTLRMYDGANWVSLGTLDPTAHRFNAAQAQGTWTPALAGTSTAGSPTYSGGFPVGSYELTGRLVTARFNIAMATVGGATGNWIINGLPFAAAAVTNDLGVGVICSQSGVSLSGSYMSMACLVTAGASSITLIKNAGTLNVTAVPVGDMGAGAQIIGFVQYHI